MGETAGIKTQQNVNEKTRNQSSDQINSMTKRTQLDLEGNKRVQRGEYVEKANLLLQTEKHLLDDQNTIESNTEAREKVLMQQKMTEQSDEDPSTPSSAQIATFSTIAATAMNQIIESSELDDNKLVIPNTKSKNTQDDAEINVLRGGCQTMKHEVVINKTVHNIHKDNCATIGLIKDAELKKEEIDIFSTFRSQGVVLKDFSSKVDNVLPIGCSQVDSKLSSRNHNCHSISELLSPSGNVNIPRKTLLSHKDTVSTSIMNRQAEKYQQSTLSDSKGCDASSISHSAAFASNASLSTSSHPYTFSASSSGIKSGTATIHGPPPGFLSSLNVHKQNRGTQSIGSGTSLSTVRSIGGSIESGKDIRRSQKSMRMRHDVTTFTHLEDIDKQTRSQINLNRFPERLTSNPPSVCSASSYSASSSADAFKSYRQGFSHSKIPWKCNFNDREINEENSLGSIMSSQNTKTTTDYYSVDFSEGNSCNTSYFSANKDMSHKSINHSINDSSLMFARYDSTTPLSILPPHPQTTQRHLDSKATIEAFGSSVGYCEISRNEASIYPSCIQKQLMTEREKEYETDLGIVAFDESLAYDCDEDIMHEQVYGDARSRLLATNKTNIFPNARAKDWMLRMSRKVADVPVGELDPTDFPIIAVMNAWTKTNSIQGATMVEMWLKRVEAEIKAGNSRPGVQPTTKMYTLAIDAWAKSGEGAKAALRAETLLLHMNELYNSNPTQYESLKPTTGIFNAVMNSWAKSKEISAPVRAEQILDWMDRIYESGNLDVKPDKYSYNTVIHAHAKRGSKDSAARAQRILDKMYQLYRAGNHCTKPDTVSYNICINAWAKSSGKGSAIEAENLLSKMHILHEMGEEHVKPNVVTYGAVIDAYAKCMEPGSASRGDKLLADMIKRYQSNPLENVDLMPNTHVFNTVINCWSKSKDKDAAHKAEEMLLAMGRLQETGIPDLRPDTFTYTAVIDAWAKSGIRGSASRAEELLTRMESQYLAGDVNLKPNTFTYNAVINSLAKSGESGAAERAERVLHNMVNRHRAGGTDDVKPTTINFNAVLDAWAKSRGGTYAAERAEKILEWMDDLLKAGNTSIKPDTITFNACIDTWARSGDKRAPGRAEQILRHMDQLYDAGNFYIKPDSYTYNTVINAWAKSGECGAANKAEALLSVMEKKYREGDHSLKPNTRTYTTTIDAWAKSGERYAAKKAEEIFIAMQALYESTRDSSAQPNAHTANAVMNACAFTKFEEDKPEALSIAFRVFEWLLAHGSIYPDAYTFTIMLSVCSNLLPRKDRAAKYSYARALFFKCREAGYVNDFVLRKLQQTVSREEYFSLVGITENASVNNLPSSWTRNVIQNKPWSKIKPRRQSKNNRR